MARKKRIQAGFEPKVFKTGDRCKAEYINELERQSVLLKELFAFIEERDMEYSKDLLSLVNDLWYHFVTMQGNPSNGGEK